MSKRIPFNERPNLFRDPAKWAREWGWVSPRKARHDAAALRELAFLMRISMDGDEGVEQWARECERIAKRIDPDPVIARTKAKPKIATKREP